jgi:hypothetical protein
MNVIQNACVEKDKINKRVATATKPLKKTQYCLLNVPTPCELNTLAKPACLFSPICFLELGFW